MPSVSNDFFFLKRKISWLASAQWQEMLSRSKLSQRQAYVDRVFGTGITRLPRLPNSYFNSQNDSTLYSHQTYEKYILFFLTVYISSSFPYSSNSIHIFIIIESSIWKAKLYNFIDLWFDGYCKREWKLLNLRVTEQSGWPFHFEKLSIADSCSWETTYWFSNLLYFARIRFAEGARTCAPSYLFNPRSYIYCEKKGIRPVFLRNTCVYDQPWLLCWNSERSSERKWKM